MSWGEPFYVQSHMRASMRFGGVSFPSWNSFGPIQKAPLRHYKLTSKPHESWAMPYDTKVDLTFLMPPDDAENKTHNAASKQTNCLQGERKQQNQDDDSMPSNNALFFLLMGGLVPAKILALRVQIFSCRFHTWLRRILARYSFRMERIENSPFIFCQDQRLLVVLFQ